MRREYFLIPICFLAGCTKEPALTPAIQTVTVGAAQLLQPDLSERYTASIEPFAQVDLAFKSSGIVERIMQVRSADGRMRDIQAGDPVAKDAELALVRPSDYQDRLDGAEAQRAQAEAQLAQAQAQLAQTRANFGEAEIEFKRDSNLFASASVVKPQYDQSKGRYDALAASVAAAEAVVKGAEAALQNARANTSGARLSLTDTSLRAPFSGWVTARNVDRGSIVSGSAAGFSLIDTHLVKAVFAVPDSTLAQIHRGQQQAVAIDALDRPFNGVITSISPQADPKTRVFSIEVTLDNSNEQIRPGMIGSLTLGATRAPKPKLVVPLSAIVRAPNNPANFAVMRLAGRAGKFYASAQGIEIGQTFGNSIEVTSGLNVGDKVIVLGGSLLRDGQDVNVLR